MDLAVLDQWIVGRVDPHIYAFTTNTIPNYLKVGDTYRPVAVRLREWREHFPDLQKEYENIAKVSDDTYFRDFAVHSFLEQEKRRIRLAPGDLLRGEYYSREFFRDATAQDVEEAIADIQKDFKDSTNKYQFYNADTHLPETHTYPRTETYPPRPNQDKTIKRFRKAIDSGRTNLLMYAVMRFGKSFTSMCCATEMEANLVTVVSAKADVKEEWKKTVQSHERFKDYLFFTGEDLNGNENIIRQTLGAGKKVVVFLSLQDLQGDDIKEKHRELLSLTIDLLIVDETHFGARAEKYGKVLRKAGKQHPNDTDDYIELDDAKQQLKSFTTRVTLHLSGTPYRILMGSEFSKDDIIAFYQFSDIVKEQEEWTKTNDAADEPEEEWENPYYGFPQMIRFAFNPNESSRRRLKELHENGVSYAFSALLKPRSIRKSDDGSHKRFVFEQEVLDLLLVIDGSKADDELLGFLDYEKIKSGNMCRHIVCVLPYCASCDAIEALICSNADKFKNLCDYEIVNISGVDQPNAYRSPSDIKRKIRECEETGKKTLTLTVNRMLTGSTVEQWDTMLFLKDTASPQEYDQAIFRLQNQYVKKYTDHDGHVIKYNMKPQTLLVDFDPNRMFTMQEQKSQIYNVNVDEAGNSRLEERIREELRISPIIVVNHDKMEEVQAADILQKVSEYSKTRGVAEETAEIPVDSTLMDIDVIRRAIERENELGSKAGFTMKAHEGDDEGSDLETPDNQTEGGDEDSHGTEPNGGQDAGTTTETRDESGKKDTVKQFRSYYARILFFAFLTRDVVISLEDIIARMETPDNARIAGNIGITKPVLEAIQGNINKFILRDLDYKIHNLNKLSHDDTVDPIERASVAVRKFGKLGESEVITPKSICDKMVSLIPDDGFKQALQGGHKLLDIAGKAGEFSLAVYERLRGLGCDTDAIKNAIYTIPTSGITYEFTRMVYEILGLNVENLAEKFRAYDLLDVRDDDQKLDYERITSLLTQAKPFNVITLQDTVDEGDEKVKFDVVVGNPPYQEERSNNGRKPPIYNYFMNISYKLSEISVLITPARFLFNAGQTPKEWNQSMLSDEHLQVSYYEPVAASIFPDAEIKGGVAITKRDTSQYVGEIGIFTAYEQLNSILRKVETVESGKAHLDSIIASQGIYRFSDVFFEEHPEIIGFSGEGTGAKIISRVVELMPTVFTHSGTLGQDVQLLARVGYTREMRYIKRQYLQENQYLDTYNVLIPESNGNGAFEVFSTPVIAPPGVGSTDTFISLGAFNGETEASNLMKYIKTKFARALLGVKKVTQHNPKATWQYVPIQDFTDSSDIDWSGSVAKIDDQLYSKYSLTDEEIAFIEATIKPME